MVNPLPCGFFNRAAPEVARALLGCRLCRRVDGATLCWRITETEAYDGPDDRASHARAGRTARTEVMFGPPGIWYVYLCYGVHWLLNIVTVPVDYPAAVLIRGAGGVRGPGRLTRAMKVDGGLNRQHASPASGLWIEPGPPPAEAAIRTTPRIGVDYAGPDWAMRPYRFLV